MITLEERREAYMKWLDHKAATITPHYRAVFDKIPTTARFPWHHEIEWAIHPYGEKSWGWGKPVKVFGGVEIRYPFV